MRIYKCNKCNHRIEMKKFKCVDEIPCSKCDGVATYLKTNKEPVTEVPCSDRVINFWRRNI